MITKNVLILSLFALLSTFSVSSQNKDYAAQTIPDSLKTNSNAVVRDNYLEVIVEDVDELIVKDRQVVTILNESGKREVITAIGYNNDTKINHLSVKIYNAFGKEIKEYKDRDFVDQKATSVGGAFHSDHRYKYVSYTPVSYPYTVVFESEYKTSTTGFIPSWYPINDYHVSVEKSTYIFKNPKQIPFRQKRTNFDAYHIAVSNSNNQLTFVVQNQPALHYEEYAISPKKILPQASIALNKITLKGVYGEFTNWKEFGKWEYENLVKGRDELSEETKLKILSLVKGIEDPVEKAKIVYKFMQDRTHYVGLQVGIQGWQPMTALDVDNGGYGDCKGLTNYTKALLDVVGVTSYYTSLHANVRKISLDKDFARLEGNHVFLNIPNKGDDIWLECTSQTLPFGYIGETNDDRNVLVTTPEGGIIKRTSSFKDESNLQITTAKIVLEKEGNLTAKVSRVSKGGLYGNRYHIKNDPEAFMQKDYKSKVWSYNNNLTIDSAEFIDDRDSIAFHEKLVVNINKYALLQNQEYIFRVNVFNLRDKVPKRYRNRKLAFEILRGRKYIEDYSISIPEGYFIGALPKPTMLNSKFGTYNSTIAKKNEKTLSYKRTLLIKSGVYTKDDYSDYRKFLKKIAKIENQRIALVKKQKS